MLYVTLIKYFILTALVVAALYFSIGYFSAEPSNEREWTLDQAILPVAQIDGSEVSIQNIRNFSYTAVDVYTTRYYDKTFNLNELVSVDYIVEPFEGIGAAHTFLSFGFKNGEYIAISVEIRKEVGESFSPLKGLLRHYELMYVIADERDVIKLRTNFRKDVVYLYPVKTSQENMRQLFVDMLERANAVRSNPEFYNTLTNTCTTNIARHVNAIAPGKIPKDLRLLLPKNSDALAYELGLLGTDLTLAQLREKHQINALAEAHADSPDFSKLIREGR